ncbi:MAG: TM2 domain-containing protein [Candidatus Woesearchaeota archaeon]
MSKSNTKEVDWSAALWLSYLFGYLGVDRFYMGKILSGVLKLLVTIFTFFVGGVVWWIIDVILIITEYKFQGVKWAFPYDKTTHKIIIIILLILQFLFILSGIFVGFFSVLI